MKLAVDLKIENIKNIKKFEYSFEFEKGVYAIVGENAVGKSTIMSCLASIVYPRTIAKFGETEISENSHLEINCLGQNDIWHYNSELGQLKVNYLLNITFNGIYEGSIFSGTRFEDMQNIDNIIKENPEFTKEFVRASADLTNALSMILHAETGHYNELYKLRNMIIARNYKLSNMPYFLKLGDGKYISKYKMSSGECMLISLLNFINSTALKPEFLTDRRKPINDRLFVFIDEVELALHPSSIIRLVDYLESMIRQKDMTVLFSTHSSELIKRIDPNNIFYVENFNGSIKLTSPCYPNYAIRSLYDHDGYDSTILVEDTMSEIIVRKLIEDFRIQNNLLINVLPIGSWGNTLLFQARTIEQNAFGRDKFLFSIIDGDVMESVNKCAQFANLKKLFLPIKSVEKYLYQKCIQNKDEEFMRYIGNKYFTLTPLESLIKMFLGTGEGKNDKSGKALFRFLLFHLERVGLSEKEFVRSLCHDLFQFENFTAIKQKIEAFIRENYCIAKKVLDS